MCDEDGNDDDNSENAIVLKHTVDSDDVLSVRSMPLQKDDDYYYYHGDGGKEETDEDEDGESVDHIGLLISSPPPLQFSDTDRDLKLSLMSATSEVTLDWNPEDAEDSDPEGDDDDEFNYTAQDCIGLKLQVADLKAQLDEQKFCYRKKYDALVSSVSSLQERNLSLEAENVGLKHLLKESQENALRDRVDARQVERLLQGKLMPLL